MDRLVIVALRVLLVLVALGSLLMQFLAVVQAAVVAQEAPEYAYLEVPYIVVVVLAIIAGQVALVALWRLLTMVARGTVFGQSALRWVDVITWCAVAATVLVLGVTSHALFVVGDGGPAVALAWLIALLGGPALVLLMLVMRRLLVTAAGLRNELEEVI